MDNKKSKSAEQRRKALKKILAGTGAAGVVAAAPESWVKPAIDSVSLPAHAQTSNMPLNFSETVVASLSPDMLDMLVPTAHAGFDWTGYMVCIKFNADMQTYSATVYYEGEGLDLMRVENANVGVVENLDFPCVDAILPATIWVEKYDPNGVHYIVDAGRDSDLDSTASPMDCQLAVCPG